MTKLEGNLTPNVRFNAKGDNSLLVFRWGSQVVSRTFSVGRELKAEEACGEDPGSQGRSWTWEALLDRVVGSDRSGDVSLVRVDLICAYESGWLSPSRGVGRLMGQSPSLAKIEQVS